MSFKRLDSAALQADPALAATLLELNNLSAVETSLLDDASLLHLVSQSFATLYTAETSALLVTLPQSADYDSPNFHWFQQRYDRFIYIDRIIVGAAARGTGIGRKLYEALFALAIEAGHTMIACEVNIDPPNPGSDAFHAAMGFTEAGIVTHPHGKTVRFLTRAI